MHQSRGSSAVGLPIWIVLVAVILLVVRVFLLATDKSSQMESPIKWLSPSQVDLKTMRPDQLILYDFSASW